VVYQKFIEIVIIKDLTGLKQQLKWLKFIPLKVHIHIYMYKVYLTFYDKLQITKYFLIKKYLIYQ